MARRNREGNAEDSPAKENATFAIKTRNSNVNSSLAAEHHLPKETPGWNCFWGDILE